jgi:hypothetical protein
MKRVFIGAICLICFYGCNTAPRKVIPDPSIKHIQVGQTQLAIKEDMSWLKQNSGDLVGFRMRIDYQAEKTFTLEESSTMNFGIQQDFSLVSGADTLVPVYFQRVANGKGNEVEYLLAFDPGNVKAPTTTRAAHAVPPGHYELLFMDPLFGLGSQAILF